MSKTNFWRRRVFMFSRNFLTNRFFRIFRRPFQDSMKQVRCSYLAFLYTYTTFWEFFGFWIFVIELRPFRVTSNKFSFLVYIVIVLSPWLSAHPFVFFVLPIFDVSTKFGGPLVETGGDSKFWSVFCKSPVYSHSVWCFSEMLFGS